MLSVFLVTFPFFALIAAGYAATRGRLLPLEAIGGINTFVLYFALPCMLYRFGARTPIAQLLDGAAALVWGLAAFALVGAVVMLSRRARIGWNDAAFGALAAVFPNTGFMGVPLLAAILGAPAAGPVIVALVFDMVVTSSLCVALSRLELAGAHGAVRAARHALAGMARNPMPWAILLGVLASARGVSLPGPIERSVAMLADAASPAALFTLGAVLARAALLPAARAQEGAEGRVEGRSLDVLALALVKLFAHPLLVLALGLAARAAGLPLAGPALAALVLVAALPSASNVSMLAERLRADSGRVARVILWTTVAAFFSFPMAVAWMGRWR